jgi:acyl-CoA dehydrogenase
VIDFTLTERQLELKERVQAFIETEIVPYERDPRVGPHGPSEELRRELNALARQRGLLAPQAPEAWGGLGLGHVDMAVAFEASGRSPLGPVAMHCAAPDEGNMTLLAKVASEEQKRRWLAPLVKGDLRSCFCLTEPMGAGSDPEQLRTTAVIDGDCFVVSGRKWLITGATQVAHHRRHWGGLRHPDGPGPRAGRSAGRGHHAHHRHGPAGNPPPAGDRRHRHQLHRRTR